MARRTANWAETEHASSCTSFKGHSHLPAVASVCLGGIVDQQSVLDTLLQVCKDSLQVCGRQSGVVFQQIAFRPALGQPLDDELHGESRSLDGRLAAQDLRIGDDVVFPVHTRIIGILPASVNAFATVEFGLLSTDGRRRCSRTGTSNAMNRVRQPDLAFSTSCRQHRKRRIGRLKTSVCGPRSGVN